jgi:hypothetical protein
MPNGEPYPSGAAYEVLSAIAASREIGQPDVHVFRNAAPPPSQTGDLENVKSQWHAVESFFAGLAGEFQTYRSIEDFEHAIEHGTMAAPASTPRGDRKRRGE